MWMPKNKYLTVFQTFNLFAEYTLSIVGHNVSYVINDVVVYYWLSIESIWGRVGFLWEDIGKGKFHTSYTTITVISSVPDGYRLVDITGFASVLGSNITAVMPFDGTNISIASSAFSGCSNLVTLPDITTWPLTEANSMFRGCSSLRELKIDLSKITNASYIFYGTKLTVTPTNKFNFTNKVTEIDYPFYGVTLTAPELKDEYFFTTRPSLPALIEGLYNGVLLPNGKTINIIAETNHNNMLGGPVVEGSYTTAELPEDEVAARAIMDTLGVDLTITVSGKCTNLGQITSDYIPIKNINIINLANLTSIDYLYSKMLFLNFPTTTTTTTTTTAIGIFKDCAFLNAIAKGALSLQSIANIDDIFDNAKFYKATQILDIIDIFKDFTAIESVERVFSNIYLYGPIKWGLTRPVKANRCFYQANYSGVGLFDLRGLTFHLLRGRDMFSCDLADKNLSYLITKIDSTTVLNVYPYLNKLDTYNIFSGILCEDLTNSIFTINYICTDEELDSITYANAHFFNGFTGTNYKLLSPLVIIGCSEDFGHWNNKPKFIELRFRYVRSSLKLSYYDNLSQESVDSLVAAIKAPKAGETFTLELNNAQVQKAPTGWVDTLKNLGYNVSITY